MKVCMYLPVRLHETSEQRPGVWGLPAVGEGDWDCRGGHSLPSRAAGRLGNGLSAQEELSHIWGCSASVYSYLIKRNNQYVTQ